MTQIHNDGRNLAQTTGQRVRDGVGAVASGIRNEAGAVASGIRNEAGAVASGIRDEIGGLRHSEPAAHKRPRSVMRTRLEELVASLAGALAAFLVSRLVRARFRAHGK